MSGTNQGAESLQVPPEFSAPLDEARAAERNGDHQAARDGYEEILHRLSRPEHAMLAAALLRWTGNTHVDDGDADAALDCYRASLAVAEATADDLHRAHALNCMGIIHQLWGHLEEAVELYARARAAADRVNAVRIVAMVDQNMGAVANIRGELDRALRHYTQSLEQYRRLGDDQYIGQALNNLGMMYTDLERWEEAAAAFDEAALVARGVEDFGTRVMVETNRTELCIARGDFERARERCDEAFELASRYDHHLGLGEAYKSYGVIYREMGKYNLAEMHLRSALEIAEKQSNPLLAGEIQRELAQVYRTLDRNQEALNSLNDAHRIFSELQARLDLADVDQRVERLEDIFLEVVRRWGESIESKDRYTAGHCQRVADYGCLLARAIGFDERMMTWFRMGAFLHDVGKTRVPAEILNKPGKLTEQEWEVMRSHTIIGEDLLASVEFPWDIRPMVRSHHEHWSGGGYPDGLQGEEISLSARILCIADVFDALTTTRSYRKGFSLEKALEIMEEDSGRIFDPDLFRTFKPLIVEHMQRRAVAAQG